MDVHPTKNVSIGIDPYPYCCMHMFNPFQTSYDSLSVQALPSYCHCRPRPQARAMAARDRGSAEGTAEGSSARAWEDDWSQVPRCSARSAADPLPLTGLERNVKRHHKACVQMCPRPIIISGILSQSKSYGAVYLTVCWKFMEIP